MKAWIGIDPGVTGAVACIAEDNSLFVLDWPGSSRAWDFLNALNKQFSIQAAVIEAIHFYPRQVKGKKNFRSSRSIDLLQRNAGIWWGILVSLGFPRLKVDPKRWQAGQVFPFMGKDPKKRSLAAARKLFPNCEHILREKDHNRADAILIARFAMNYNAKKIGIMNQGGD